MYTDNEPPVAPDTDVTLDSYYAYLNEISEHKVLSIDEEIAMFEKIQDGDNVARDLFVKANLRLVVKVARKYYVQGHNDLLDLIQEGNLGLIKAVEKFDLSKGCKFSTYAVYLINKAIQRSPLRSGLPLEIPPKKTALIHKIKSFISEFETNCDRKPSFMEISSALNVAIDDLIDLMPFITPTVSLYSKLGEDSNSKEFVDVFDKYYEEEPTDPEKIFIMNETKDEFRKIINKVLNEKEKYILYSRRGLSDTPVKDVATLAEELGMSKQGIRQSEERSIEKLRRRLLALNKSLSDFV